jgi:hypothetical protein
MDVTGSMQPSIELVRTNVHKFAEQAASIDFGGDIKVEEIKLGGVAFADALAEQQVIPLGGPEAFGEAVGSLVASGGGDPAEGGLLALKTALDAFKAAPKRDDLDFVPIVVMISDTFSHNGDPSDGGLFSRKCDTKWPPLAALMADKISDRLLIYDATPTTAVLVAPCLPDAFDRVAANEWVTLRKEWTATRGGKGKAPGRGFDFPFTEDELVASLPADIKAAFASCK